jgi:hypothetical protein
MNFETLTSLPSCVYTMLRLMHLHLDPTIVDPLCSDPTNGIYSSPLCFLCSLDTDLMVQLLSTTDLTEFFIPPPELLTSSDLEEFVSVQRFWPLNFFL